MHHVNQQTTFSSFFPQSNIAGGGDGYILHIYNAGAVYGLTLHDVYTLQAMESQERDTPCWKENTPTSTLLTV